MNFAQLLEHQARQHEAQAHVLHLAATYIAGQQKSIEESQTELAAIRRELEALRHMVPQAMQNRQNGHDQPQEADHATEE